MSRRLVLPKKTPWGYLIGRALRRVFCQMGSHLWLFTGESVFDQYHHQWWVYRCRNCPMEVINDGALQP